MMVLLIAKSFPDGSDGKESACNVEDCGFDPWVMKIPWRREWQSTPVSLPGEFRGQRSLGATVHRVAELDTATFFH